ncbi:hypothetical protein GDO86_013768, partial [Hymenochirus boettgeri]
MPYEKDHLPEGLTFGVIADVQYADRDDGLSVWKTMRYYRPSLHHLRSAIREWNNENPPPKFVLQLGDVIDGSNKRFSKSEESLRVVLNEFGNLKAPCHHVWGNHDFYNFGRYNLNKSALNTRRMEDLIPSISCSENSDFYAYHFSPSSNFRFILIDTYDLSTYGDFSEPHMVTFNGGLSQAQLVWLNKVLTYSDKLGEKVIIASHVPIHPKAKPTSCLAWNYREILKTVQSHPCVVCYFAGHDHHGGFYQDASGIHHITMQGVIETPPDSNAFATVHMYEDRMVLHGRGRVKSRELNYRT